MSLSRRHGELSGTRMSDKLWPIIIAALILVFPIGFMWQGLDVTDTGYTLANCAQFAKVYPVSVTSNPCHMKPIGKTRISAAMMIGQSLSLIRVPLNSPCRRERLIGTYI